MTEYTPMAPEHGLLFAWNGGAGCPIVADSIAEAERAIPAGGWGWLHLDGNREETGRWLRSAAVAGPALAEILLARNTRPRYEADGDQVVFVGRGINLNPDALPEDMVSVRFWLRERCLVTVVLRPVRACIELIEQLGSNGARSHGPPALFIAINRRMIDRMSPAIEQIRNELDDIYERIIDEGVEVRTGELVPLRSAAIVFHRYISPLGVSMRELSECPCGFLDDGFGSACRENADRLTRLTEDLAAIQARAAVAREEITSQSSERLNRRVYTLTVLAVIALPLTVLTGALGMNVGGLPGLEDPGAFWVTMGLLGVFVALEIVVLRRFRWI
jgi:zinc transporter